MSESKRCIRCERAIDGWARICPYCNWDQSNLAPPPAAAPREVVAAPGGNDDLRELIKRKGLYAGGGILILVAAFLIGMVINSDGAPKNVPDSVIDKEKPIAPIKRADTPLVPTDERGGIEQPITSAPLDAAPNGLPSGYDRSDATAVSSAEYTQLAKRVRAEKERMAVAVDPRSISGAAYAQGQRAPRPSAGADAPHTNAPVRASPGTIRTRPVPQYQPIPRINARGTARLTLIIGSDGRVRDINIERALSRDTAELVAAVQRWRFRPATENGQPIQAPYSVDISFGGQ